jgi:hypothetical protein
MRVAGCHPTSKHNRENVVVKTESEERKRKKPPSA